MSDHPREPGPSSATEEAIDWFVRRDADPLSAPEQAAFEAWLAADPAHRAAHAEIERIWSDLSAHGDARHRAVRRTDRGAELAASSGLYAPRSRSWRWSAVGAAAGIVLLVVAADMPMRLQADVMSGVGETRTATLPDGSTAVLNTDSAIAVDYAPDQRRVRLLRGEVEFTVAADASRPFRVEAAGGHSTALGTVFSVRRQNHGATVAVLQGAVAIAYGRDAGPAQEVALGPEQQVTYAAGRGLGPVEKADRDSATAWRRGKLIFVDRDLGDAIDELDRYHLGAIRILDDSLRSRKVNGVFETRDPVAVVDALEESLSLRSTRLSGLLILLHR